MQPHLPTRTPPGATSFDTRPAQLEQWINQLPILNTGETTRQLFSALIEMNQLDIGAQQRFRALELLRPSIINVLLAMQKHYVGQPLPLADKGRKVLELSEALLNQLATGYRICVADEDARSVLRKDKKLLTTAIHRALSALSECLLRAYLVYAPCPSGLWRTVHQLYSQAEERSLVHAPVRLDDDEAVADTISGAYKQLLLLALTSPYRLRQGEVGAIYAVLRQWAEHVSLEDYVQPRSPDQIFITSLDSDDPPTYLVLRHQNYHRRNCRLLDTAELAEVTQSELDALQHNGARNTSLQAGTLRRLMLAWGVMPKRRFSRSEQGSKARVAIGLSAVHHFISGGETFDAGSGGLEERARFTAAEPGEPREEAPDVWDLRATQRWQTDEFTVRMFELAEDTDEAAADAPEPTAAGTEAAYSTHVWRLVNASAGGYCLLWDSRDSTDAQVGELIGIHETVDDDTDPAQLALGIIRWMKCPPGKGAELGVQMLSPGAVSVATRVIRAGREMHFMRSLLLPEIRQINQPASLITPTLPYQAGDQVELNSHGKLVRVRLNKLLENTGSFCQFQFTALEEIDRATEPDPEHPTMSPADFESLWKEI
ncbi:MAG: hypothetical protein CMN57_11775 [Gammaproteobacteria bacterium]|nr:hypothetical protein [Gammaproteobacteria bacterium]